MSSAPRPPAPAAGAIRWSGVRVAREVRNDFVSRRAAFDDYGVVFVGARLTVDEAATAGPGRSCGSSDAGRSRRP